MTPNEILGQHPMYAEEYFVHDRLLQAFYHYGLDWEGIPCKKKASPLFKGEAFKIT